MNHYLYAETAFHHAGDEGYLRELIHAIGDTGIQAIKFQVLLDVNNFVSSRLKTYSTIHQWIFSLEKWRTFFELALERGLEIVMMPLDPEAFLLAQEFPIAYLDLHSVSFHDSVILQMLEASGHSVIIGVGGRTQNEIEDKVCKLHGRPLVLMTGFQAFPTDLTDIRLSRIAYLKEMYPDCSIGYADHTAFDDPYTVRSLEYAYLMGARIFEKHVTLHEGRKRVDYEAAVGLEKLQMIKKRLNYLEQLVGHQGKDSFDMSPAELRYRDRQKVVVARWDMQAGHILEREDLCLKIIDGDNGITQFKSLVGKRLSRNVRYDESVTFEDIV